MRATQVEEKEGVLVFKGEYFLTEQGLPTEKTTAVFNMFKYLAHHLSPEFTLQNNKSLVMRLFQSLTSIPKPILSPSVLGRE